MPRGDPRRALQGALWALAIGALLAAAWFPDAISRLRQAGARYAEADPACVGACSARFSDGQVVHLTASPQPARSGQPVRVTVAVEGESRPVALELQGADMAMGLLRLPFAADGTVSVDLPVCTTERMRWRADVVLDDRAAGFTLWSTR